MTTVRKYFGLIAVGLMIFGSANASPILVDPSEAGSEVNVEVVSSNCIACFIHTSISDDLDAEMAWLDVGQSFTFDFFDIVVGALIGSAQFEIDVLLALAQPGVTAGADGFGAFASFLFIFNGIQLDWTQPDAIALRDGTFLSVVFENLFELGVGNTTTVSATITRFDAAAVPEPETAALLLIGLFAMWFASRKTIAKRSEFNSASAA